MKTAAEFYASEYKDVCSNFTENMKFAEAYGKYCAQYAKDHYYYDHARYPDEMPGR